MRGFYFVICFLDLVVRRADRLFDVVIRLVKALNLQDFADLSEPRAHTRLEVLAERHQTSSRSGEVDCSPVSRSHVLGAADWATPLVGMQLGRVELVEELLVAQGRDVHDVGRVVVEHGVVER